MRAALYGVRKVFAVRVVLAVGLFGLLGWAPPAAAQVVAGAVAGGRGVVVEEVGEGSTLEKAERGE